MTQRDNQRRVDCRDGTSQGRRMDPALSPDAVAIDGRSLTALYDFIRGYAREVRFTDAAADPDATHHTWETFFDALPADLVRALDDAADAEAVEAALDALEAGGSVQPHLALVLAFLRLYRHARQEINGLTRAHLDFYFKRMLGFRHRPPAADRVHLCFTLKKRIASHPLTAGTRMSAGKDATGVPLHYRLDHDLMVYPVAIDSLRSVYRRSGGRERLHVAPVADSMDGLGEALDRRAPRFRPFGHEGLPPAEIGFALSAPILRLGQGARTIHIDLTLIGGIGLRTLLDDAFDVYLTGAKGWLGPLGAACKPVKGRHRLTVELAADAGAVVDHDETVHGGGFAADGPVIQFKLKTAGGSDYGRLKKIVLTACRLQVAVTGMTPPALTGDMGSLDATKPFMPFGPEPTPGSTLSVDLGEAAAKRIGTLHINLTWKAAPTTFSSIYDMDDYRVSRNTDFTADVTAPLGGTRQSVGSLALFDADDAAAVHTIALPTGSAVVATRQKRADTSRQQQLLARQKTRWADKRIQTLRRTSRTPASTTAAVTAKKPSASHQPSVDASAGTLALRLKRSFLHAEYRRLYTTQVVAMANGTEDAVLPKEPYTPLLESLTLDYTAATDTVDLRGTTADDFLNGDLFFFHLGAFGQRPEHAFVRAQLPFVKSRMVTLLPDYAHEGEFYIGLAGIAPDQSVSLLFQVVEGTANPLKARPPIRWSILADNYWAPLGSDRIVRDTTNGLLASGIVTIAIPDAATDTNTLLPAGSYWLRAVVDRDSDAVCDLTGVYPNAVSASFLDQGNDPEHLAAPLPAGTATGFAAPQAGIKTVVQPFASFGGRMAETDHHLYTRAAERLRHKQRAVAAWDYERLVLEAFPSVHKVKCLNHTAPDGLAAPGHVTLVVVPRMVGLSAVDPLAPKVDLDTLDRIRTCLAGRCAPGVTLHVQNPDYTPLRCSFAVRLKPAQAAEFGHYRGVLERDIQAFLTPWAFAADEAIAFGGRIYASVVLQFVETRDYVAYVTDFNLYQGTATLPVQMAAADDPRTILVSAAAHDIRKIDTP